MYLIDNRIGQIGTVFITLYDHTKYQILTPDKNSNLDIYRNYCCLTHIIELRYAVDVNKRIPQLFNPGTLF
jgi:hypothetical protein